MGDQTDNNLNREQMSAFISKLDDFRSSLTPVEQALLGRIIDRARSTYGEDVSGYEDGASRDPIHDNPFGWLQTLSVPSTESSQGLGSFSQTQANMDRRG